MSHIGYGGRASNSPSKSQHIAAGGTPRIIPQLIRCPMKTVVHMRDRARTACCYDHSSDDEEPKTVPDGLDMRGQPGQR